MLAGVSFLCIGMGLLLRFWRRAARVVNRSALRGVLLIGCVASTSGAANVAATFDAANRLYDQGKHLEAAAAYENLKEGGDVSAALYFNLGNAYFKAGQIGRAIAAYRQAQNLTPRDPDVRANLHFARSQIQGPTLRWSAWARWLGKLTVDEWTLVVSVSLWVLLLLLALLQWRPAWKPAVRVYIYGVVCVLLFSSVALAAVLIEHRPMRTAIIITDNARAHMSPFEEAQTAFVVHDGAELRVLDAKDQWLLVSAGSGPTGWVRREQLLLPM